MRRILVVVVFVLMTALAGTALAAAPQSSASSSQAIEVATDLLWAANGILAMDKNPSLRVTPAQASKLLAQFHSLTDKRLISLKADNGGNSGDNGGGAQGRNLRDISPAEAEKLRQRREERLKQVEAVVNNIDKILTSKQTSFIDNMDFDTSQYQMSRPNGSAGFGAGGASGGGRPSPQQLAEMRKRVRAARERTAKLYQQTLDYLQKRAKGQK